MTPRAYTVEEIREQLVAHLCELARYWAELPDKTDLERVCGAIFSMLVVFDGESGGMPGFQVIPDPHPDDREWHIGLGQNFYPSAPTSEYDITGELHAQFIRSCPLA